MLEYNKEARDKNIITPPHPHPEPPPTPPEILEMCKMYKNARGVYQRASIYIYLI